MGNAASLTPEERQRIYLEEHARLSKPKKSRTFPTVVLVLSVIVGLIWITSRNTTPSKPRSAAEESAQQWASGVEDLRHRANACVECEQQKAIDVGLADQYGTKVVKDAALVRCAAIINEASTAQTLWTAAQRT